jgi:hypothetical protein
MKFNIWTFLAIVAICLTLGFLIVPAIERVFSKYFAHEEKMVDKRHMLETSITNKPRKSTFSKILRILSKLLSAAPMSGRMLAGV